MFKKIWGGVVSVWQWFNGNKTVIGSSMLVASEVISEKTVLYAILRIGGTVLAGGGIAHKYTKGELNKMLPQKLQKTINSDLPSGLSEKNK